MVWQHDKRHNVDGILNVSENESKRRKAVNAESAKGKHSKIRLPNEGDLRIRNEIYRSIPKTEGASNKRKISPNTLTLESSTAKKVKGYNTIEPSLQTRAGRSNGNESLSFNLVKRSYRRSDSGLKQKSSYKGIESSVPFMTKLSQNISLRDRSEY